MSNIIDKIRLSGVTYTLSGQSGGGVPESAFTAYTASTDNRISTDEEVTAAGLNALNDKINNISGTATVELTQAEYDALVSAGTVSADTYYIITDATPIDISNYWTSAQTQSAITEATSGKASQSDLETVSGQVANKQDTLVSGTNIKTINNESLLGSGNIDIQGGGGGKAVSGGTNISITTGETADTINCTLPISASSEGIYTTSSYPFSSTARKTGNVVFGYNNRLDTFGSSSQSNYNTFFGSNHYITVKGDNMFIAGDNNRIGYPSNNNISNIVLFGYNNKSSNPYETAFGRYNVSQYSNSSLVDSGNTLFSVGNGTADNTRHNAFEIRQNGDIYLSSGGTDIKLQDHLGGGSITVDNALDDSSENPVQNKVLYDELRIVEGSELVLEWENNDGGNTLNYPIGTSTLEFYVDESQMTYGHFDLISNAEQGSVGGITIESNSGVITVSDEWSIDYTISGNVVTVSYPTVASTVDYIDSSYDCYWSVKAVNKTVTPLIDKVGEIEEVTAAALNQLNDKMVEDEEVTAAGLNALNDKFGGLKLVKLTQTEYNNLSTKDNNTLYVIV